MKNENITPHKDKKTNSQKFNKPKGELLEQVVAILYQTPGAKIQKNVDYPTTDGKRTREIDILWTTNIAGLPVEYAFQCKNEVNRIGEGKISQFFGDLTDIGIPSRNGVFVSVNGFTSQAQALATKYGIKTLVLKGLTKDRLKSEINSAIQHNIYLIPRIEEISVLNAASQTEYEYQFGMFFDEYKRQVGIPIDLIFNKWRNGEISEKLGNHSIEMDAPINWFQFYRGKSLPSMKISAKISVLAVVITIDGIAENHFLFDAETRKIEMARTQVKFQGFKEGDEIPLTVFSSEQELKDFTDKSGITSLTIKTKLPRIISNSVYYPLSKSVADRVFGELIKYQAEPNQLTQEKFDKILFDSSQNDLFREGIYNLFGRVISVILLDNDGDLVDLTLIAEAGDIDKVIALTDRYSKNPSNSFRDILAWAYEEKSQQLLDKAKVAKVNQDNLLKQSLKFVETSLNFKLESISALEKRIEILLLLKNYDEALKTIDFVLAKKSQHIDLHLQRIFTLIRLKKWEFAVKGIKNTEELLKISKESIESARYSIKIFQAEILHEQGKFDKAWLNILTAWEKYPEGTIEYLAGREFVDDTIREITTIESRWFLIELLYFRAAHFYKMHEYELAKQLTDHAIVLLNGIKLLNQMEDEPIAVGEMRMSVLESILIRIAKILRSANSKIFVEEQINKISYWFEQTYKEEPIFLKS